MMHPHATKSSSTSLAASQGRYVAPWVDWTALVVLVALAVLTAVLHL